MIWGSKCHQNNSPVVCDGYVKYEDAEVDRLVAILKQITAAADRVEYSKQPALKQRGLLKYVIFAMLAVGADTSAHKTTNPHVDIDKVSAYMQHND